MWQTALGGFQLSFGLIVAIGPQNACVLRQGIRREHVFAVCLFCAASDAALIAVGVTGIRTFTTMLPEAVVVLRWFGVAFLFWYGLRAFRAAWAGGETLRAGAGASETLPKVIATLAIFTWANPHVWLDTVVLIGSVASQYPGEELAFGLGAATASFVFFFMLGYGARVLSPLFAQPASWRVLDVIVGMIMWSIAARLALG